MPGKRGKRNLASDKADGEEEDLTEEQQEERARLAARKKALEDFHERVELCIEAQNPSLDVSGLCLGTPEACVLASRLLPGCPELTELNVSNNELQAESTTALAHALESHPGITRLDISGNAVTKGQPRAGYPGLPGHLLAYEVDTAGLEALGLVIRNNPTLTDLNISGTTATGVHGDNLCGIIAICEGVRKSKGITALDMSKNVLCAEGGRRIAPALDNNDLLTSLNASSGYMGIKNTGSGGDVSGFNALLNAIENSGALVHLDLGDNRLDMLPDEYEEIIKERCKLKGIVPKLAS
jgi:Leucine-rich repeat (LRR) protein